MNLKALLAKADSARFDGKSARPQRWAGMFPVYQKLRQRGASCVQAVEWLVSEGLVPKDEAHRALKAFQVTTSNRNKKAKSAP